MNTKSRVNYTQKIVNPTAEYLRGLNLAVYLRAHGIRPSHQRLEILRYLAGSDSHPTVQQIYEELSKANPTLSKTTVYNTLKLFVERQLVEEITIEGHESRFDVRDSSHGHFKCDGCGGLYDIPFPIQTVSRTMPDGFDLREVHLHFRGFCPACSASVKTES